MKLLSVIVPCYYGKKAVLHRSLMPALRYGLMIGAMKNINRFRTRALL